MQQILIQQKAARPDKLCDTHTSSERSPQAKQYPGYCKTSLKHSKTPVFNIQAYSGERISKTSRGVSSRGHSEPENSVIPTVSQVPGAQVKHFPAFSRVPTHRTGPGRSQGAGTGSGCALTGLGTSPKGGCVGTQQVPSWDNPAALRLGPKRGQALAVPP